MMTRKLLIGPDDVVENIILLEPDAVWEPAEGYRVIDPVASVQIGWRLIDGVWTAPDPVGDGSAVMVAGRPVPVTEEMRDRLVAAVTVAGALGTSVEVAGLTGVWTEAEVQTALALLWTRL